MLYNNIESFARLTVCRCVYACHSVLASAWLWEENSSDEPNGSVTNTFCSYTLSSVVMEVTGTVWQSVVTRDHSVELCHWLQCYVNAM